MLKYAAAPSHKRPHPSNTRAAAAKPTCHLAAARRGRCCESRRLPGAAVAATGQHPGDGLQVIQGSEAAQRDAGVLLPTDLHRSSFFFAPHPPTLTCECCCCPAAAAEGANAEAHAAGCLHGTNGSSLLLCGMASSRPKQIDESAPARHISVVCLLSVMCLIACCVDRQRLDTDKDRFGWLPALVDSKMWRCYNSHFLVTLHVWLAGTMMLCGMLQGIHCH